MEKHDIILCNDDCEPIYYESVSGEKSYCICICHGLVNQQSIRIIRLKKEINGE